MNQNRVQKETIKYVVKKTKSKDSLGDRMKNNYENRSKTYLIRRMPVILRFDGKAFHTYLHGFKRPYDEFFHKVMNSTMEYLCKNIQGCKIGYTQSDEITLLLTDYDTLTTDAWFDYSVQKVCSIGAAMATMAFNKFFNEYYGEFMYDAVKNGTSNMEEEEYIRMLQSKIGTAMFDCRCFNIPKEEVANCFIWRQQDATRNAVQMLGQANFSHKELQGKSCNEIQDMLMLQRNINFNDMPTEFKRGTCCVRTETQNPHADDKDGTCTKMSWFIDREIPIFSKMPEYIEKFVYI